MALELSLRLMTYLSCLSLSIQTAEYLWLLNKGVFALTSSSRILSGKSRSMREESWMWGVFFFRFFLLAYCVYEPFSVAVIVLFVSQIGVMLWWHGPFNGGSDYMTLQVLLVLSLSLLYRSHPIVIRGALLYLGIQVLFSYLIAGWVKIKNESWRKGQALEVFLRQSIYKSSAHKPLALAQDLLKNQSVGFWVSWGIMLWELSFLGLLFPIDIEGRLLVFFYIGTAIVFHFMNFILFGLNRFFWSWLSALPALAYLILSK